MATYTTTPKDWADGVVVNASDFDTHIKGFANAFGALGSYTPTLGGTGWALGNGTATGKYLQVQKMVYVRARITFGSTSTYGSAALTISLPVTPADTQLLTGRVVDVSAGATCAFVAVTSGATVVSRLLDTAPTSAGLTSTAPMTFASGDIVEFNGWFEAA